MSKVKNNASLLSDGFVSMSIDQITLPLENIGANLTSSFGINLSGDIDFSSGNYNISGSATSTGSFGTLVGDGSGGSITGFSKDVVTDASPKLGANIDLAGYTLTDTSFATVGDGNVDYRGIFQAINLPNTKLVVTSNNLPSGSSLLGETLDIQTSLTGSDLQISASSISFASLLISSTAVDPRVDFTSIDGGYGLVDNYKSGVSDSALESPAEWAGEETSTGLNYRILTKSASFGSNVTVNGKLVSNSVNFKAISYPAAENLDAYVPVQLSSSGKIFAWQDESELIGITSEAISQNSTGSITLKGGVVKNIPSSLVTPTGGADDELATAKEIYWLTGSAQYTDEDYSTTGFKVGLALNSTTILMRG